MDIRMQTRAVNMLYRLFLRGSTSAHQIPYIPSKTELPAPSAGDTPLVAPEEVGVSCGAVSALLSELERCRGAVIHTIGMARGGRVFSLAAAPGYDITTRHQTHSMCKTVTALAVGILYDEGKIDLDTPAYQLVGEGLPALLTGKTKAITVRHLLAMQAGVVFGEVGSVTEEDWVRSFFESGVSFRPGSAFSYNSMNSYILSVIVERITGKTLADFAAERLFAPLGIRPTLWESCPRGHTKGGWGLYLSVEDMLKLGELIAAGGVYREKRLLSRDWMRAMTGRRARTPESLGPFDYGYHIWVSRERGTCLCNGMLGQNILIEPKTRTVVAINAGNCELFPNGPMLGLVEKYVGEDFAAKPERADRRTLLALREQEARFFSGRTWTHAQKADALLRDGGTPAERWDALTGTLFIAEKNNFGILPIFVMLMQNNHAAGLHSFSFGREGEAYYLDFAEGGECFRLAVGFGEYKRSEITLRGEVFRVAVRAEFCDDTDGDPILKLEVIFPEMACARRIRLYYDTDAPAIVLSEQPGRRMMDEYVKLFDHIPYGKLLGAVIRPQLERDSIAYRVRTCYEPTLCLGRGTPPTDHALPTPEGEEQPFTAFIPEKPARKKRRILPFFRR